MGQIAFADATHIREQAKVKAARIKQAASNERRGAESSLAAFSQALGNQRRMDAAGDEHASIILNAGRNLDAATYGTLASRVAAAEELGANMAQAAAAGIGGSSVDTYNSTLRLSASMAEEQNDRAINTARIGSGNAAGDAIRNGVAGLGNDRFSADLDYSEYVDHRKQSFLGRMTTLGTAAAAAYFGGPQAGMAVMQMSEANQAARNGDFAGADRAFGSALHSAEGGWKAYKSNADDAHPGGKPLLLNFFKNVGAKLGI